MRGTRNKVKKDFTIKAKSLHDVVDTSDLYFPNDFLTKQLVNKNQETQLFIGVFY